MTITAEGQSDTFIIPSVGLSENVSAACGKAVCHAAHLLHQIQVQSWKIWPLSGPISR